MKKSELKGEQGFTLEAMNYHPINRGSMHEIG